MTQRALNLSFRLVPGPSAGLKSRYGVSRVLPASTIVDKAGRVRWQYIGKTFTDRPTMDAIVAELKKLEQ